MPDLVRDLADLPPVLTVDQIRRVLAVGRRQAYQLVGDGTVRSIRIGARGIRVPRSALIAFLAGENEMAAPVVVTSGAAIIAEAPSRARATR